MEHAYERRVQKDTKTYLSFIYDVKRADIGRSDEVGY